MSPISAADSVEGLDGDHLPLMTGRALPEGTPGELLVTIAVLLRSLALRWLGNRHAEQIAAMGKLLFAIPIAKETVIADPMKALGQDMQQKTADEFAGRDGHDLLPIAVPIILPAETHRAILDIDEPVVGDGDTMRVAADVIEDLLGPCEGRLGVDHPVGLSKGRQIAPEGVALVEVLQGGEELQLARVEGLLKVLQEQAAKQA